MPSNFKAPDIELAIDITIEPVGILPTSAEFIPASLFCSASVKTFVSALVS